MCFECGKKSPGHSQQHTGPRGVLRDAPQFSAMAAHRSRVLLATWRFPLATGEAALGMGHSGYWHPRGRPALRCVVCAGASLWIALPDGGPAQQAAAPAHMRREQRGAKGRLIKRAGVLAAAWELMCIRRNERAFSTYATAVTSRIPSIGPDSARP